MANHAHDLGPFQHAHSYIDAGGRQREQALTRVTLITLAAMLLELAAGWWSGSLALLADGWHMGTHALALGGAVLAFRLSARAATRQVHAFGGWKIEVLTAYTSGLMLLVAAAWIVVGAVARLQQPEPIAFAEAMVVAVFGLGVNLLCAWLLSRGAAGAPRAQGSHGQPAGSGQPTPAHEHAHSHGHSHAHGHHDHNFSAAYLHVLADAFTSVLAIAALAGGLWLGWAWLDAAVALLGAVVIGRWAVGVLVNSASALTDATADPAISQRIRELLEADGDAQVSDLHVWQVGTQAWAAALSVVADRPQPALAYRQRLAAIETLRHVTVEVHRCPGASHG